MQVDKALSIFGYTNVNEVSKKGLKSDYRRLGKIYHPDNKNTGDSGKFKELKSAYMMLNIWIDENTFGSLSRGKIKFEFDELESTKNQIYIKDINGNKYERKFAVNSDAYVVFEPTIGINDTPYSQIILSRYSMIGTYDLFVEVEIDTEVTVEKIYVNICNQERDLSVCGNTGNFEFRFKTESASIGVRLRLKRLSKEIKPVYIVCKTEGESN